MKTTQTHNGTTIYAGFNYPEDISTLDIDIIKATLNYYWFIAEMSDDYNQTRKEQSVINEYRQKHNL